MAQTIDERLQSVYSKWENKGPGPRNDKAYQDVRSTGQQAWKAKQIEAGPMPVRRYNNRYRNSYRSNYLPPPVNRGTLIAPFKSSPSIYPVVDKRPFMGRCCSCMPNSKNNLYEEDTAGKGLRNILAVEGLSRCSGILSRTFHRLFYGLRANTGFVYPDVQSEVLGHNRVIDAIQRTVLEDEGISDPDELEAKQWTTASKKYQKRAKALFNQMKSCISNVMIQLVGWTLHIVLRRLLASLVVHRGQMESVQKACQSNLPVIFLPNHICHLDYMLLTFVLYNYDIRPPHVAAGENLSMPVIGPILNACGGYFIRRRLDGKCQTGRKDMIYRAVLHTYMQELLSKKQYFEFFVEGGRSRSGKVIFPKGGLLSVVVHSYLDGSIPDAYIVPVSISYDGMTDGNFVREQLGQPKLRENLWRAVSGLWRFASGFYGHVRINYSQPFSLKEYMQVSQSYDYSNQKLCQWESDPDSPCDLEPDSPIQSPGTGILAPCGSNTSLSGSDILGDGMRQTIQGLAVHVVNNVFTCQAIMSTHFVAFLLLTKFRKGVSFEKFVLQFESLRDEVLSKRRDVGFSGKSRDVIMHACGILSHNLVTLQTKDKKRRPSDGVNNNEDLWIAPVTTLPRMIELNFFANPLNSLYATESILALTLNTLVTEEQWNQRGHELKVVISRKALLNNATDLCILFQYEFVLRPPCKSWEAVLLDALDELLASEVLISDEEDTGPADQRKWAQRFSKSLSMGESDSEEEMEVDELYVVNLVSAYSTEKLHHLQSVVAPFLETYQVVACSLMDLGDNPMTEQDFVKAAHNKLKCRVDSGIASYAEGATLDITKNALNSFKQIGAVVLNDNELFVPGNNTDKIDELTGVIESYRPLWTVSEL